MKGNHYVIVSIKSDADGRLLHLHDLQSQTTFTYLDDRSNGLIDVENSQQRTTVSHRADVLEEYSLESIEMKPKPGGQNLKVYCTDNFGSKEKIVYTIIDACDNYQYGCIPLLESTNEGQ